jgi:hypothetical protein
MAGSPAAPPPAACPPAAGSVGRRTGEPTGMLRKRPVLGLNLTRLDDDDLTHNRAIAEAAKAMRREPIITVAAKVPDRAALHRRHKGDHRWSYRNLLRTHLACARPSNLKKDLTDQNRTPEIFQPGPFRAARRGPVHVGGRGPKPRRGSLASQAGRTCARASCTRWLSSHRSRRRLIPPKVLESCGR